MRHRRLAPSALAGLATLVLAAAPASAATAGRIELPFEPLAMNDAGVVLGARYAIPSFVRWTNGAEQALAVPAERASADALAETGLILGSHTPDAGDTITDVVRWAPGSAAMTTAGTYDRATALLGRGVDDQGRWLLRPFVGAGCPTAQVRRSDGASLAVENVRAGLSASPQIAADGSFAVNVTTCEGAITSRLAAYWRSADGAIAARLDDVVITDVRPGGLLAGVAADTGPTASVHTPALFRLDPATRRLVRTDAPIPGLAAGAAVEVLLDRAGRMWANVLDRSTVSLWAYSGGAWRDITASLVRDGYDQKLAVTRIADVNGAGDLLLRHIHGSEHLGSIVRRRVIVSGQVEASAATGARATRAVTIISAAGTATAPVSASGRFSAEVPPGAVRVIAPARSCIATASGCLATVAVDVPESAARVALATTRAPGIAALAHAKGALLRARKGVVAVKVRCAAPGRCRATVTLRSGRTVLGSGTATVRARRTGTVPVRLTKAAAAAVASRKRPRPVRAGLLARAGGATVDLTLALRLGKG